MNGLGESILVATRSALSNTNLRPNLIYDGEPNVVTRYLERIGVTVHYHQNSFLSAISTAQSKAGFNPNIVRGAYLRYDIPLVDTSDDTVLYTDADVVFVKQPSCLDTPPILGAAPHDLNKIQLLLILFRPGPFKSSL